MTTSPANDGTAAVRPVPFISRVRLTNYKSIAFCDVRLEPLTVLVGPNGSGKSNFLDALALLARALETTPTQAIEERGGLTEILRRVPEPAGSFSIAVTVKVPWEPSADVPGDAAYEFEIGRLHLQASTLSRSSGNIACCITKPGNQNSMPSVETSI